MNHWNRHHKSVAMTRQDIYYDSITIDPTYCSCTEKDIGRFFKLMTKQHSCAY